MQKKTEKQTKTKLLEFSFECNLLRGFYGCIRCDIQMSSQIKFPLKGDII